MRANPSCHAAACSSSLAPPAAARIGAGRRSRQGEREIKVELGARIKNFLSPHPPKGFPTGSSLREARACFATSRHWRTLAAVPNRP